MMTRRGTELHFFSFLETLYTEKSEVVVRSPACRYLSLNTEIQETGQSPGHIGGTADKGSVAEIR